MTAESLFQAITDSNQQLMPYFVRYCKQMLENSGEQYWEEERLAEARFIYLNYFQQDYELYFHYLDADIDEVYENETYSFTEFLAEYAPDLAEKYQGFIPASLAEDEHDLLIEYTMEVEEWMAETFKAVFADLNENTANLPVVFREEDSERFMDIATGETYDHVELKTYAFDKLSTEELLSLMQDKLSDTQRYFLNFSNFQFENEGQSVWSEENRKRGKAVVIRPGYDSGSIYLDLLDAQGEIIQKETDWNYADYMKEKEAFVYRRLGIYFPFEVYDYIQGEREDEIAPFRDAMNHCLAEAVKQSRFAAVYPPCLIREGM